MARPSGDAGVRLFFAISGFLICTRLLAELARARPGAMLASFYIRRAFRIVPPLVPYLGLVAVGGALGWLPVQRREIVAAVLFVANYITGKSWYTHHFWSLAIEEHFYLLWAPLLAFAGRARAAAFALVVIVATAIVRPMVLDRVRDPVHALQLTHLNLDAFMFPCALAIALAQPSLRDRVVALMCGKTSVVLPIVALTAALAGRLAIPGLDPRSVVAPCLAIVVALPSIEPASLVTQALEQRWLTWLGGRSYGIYIWQELIFTPSTAPLSQKLLTLVVRLVAVLVIAELSFLFLERPLLAVGRTLASRFIPVTEPLRDDTVGQVAAGRTS